MKIALKTAIMLMAVLALSLSCSGKAEMGGKSGEEEEIVTKGGPFDVTVGKPLPKWEQGVLDIHAINSGRGECTFFILPDGTTMVVDAGDLYAYKNSSYENVTPKPDGNTEPYKVYASYIQKYMPSDRLYLDYFLLTHYHIDHAGYIGAGRSVNENGGYELAGVTGLYSIVPFKRLMDRSYPDYSKETIASVENMAFYVKFVEYEPSASGLKVEKFKVGVDDQIVMQYAPEDYDCKIMNLACSGAVWDGSKVVQSGVTAENALSNAFLLSYGPFDYFSSGDLNNNNALSPIVNGIGRQIEAQKCHHHMSNPSSYSVEQKVLNAKVVVTQSFYIRDIQPHQSIISEYSKGQDMFFTNIDASLIDNNPAVYNYCKAVNGHVVIRVAEGGGKFYVYMLDDNDYRYIVTSIHGPYTCR